MGAVTAPARISQADIDRAAKVASKYDRARIILDLDARRIEIIIGESAGESASAEEWSDDDV